MTVRKWIILIVSALLILALILYFVPLPKQISVQLPGAEVDKDGNVIAQGEITLEGIYYHYLFQQPRFQLTHLELPNVKDITTIVFENGAAQVHTVPDGTNTIWAMVALEIPSQGESNLLESTHFAGLFSRPDFSHFLLDIHQGNTHMYYIGTEEAAPDYEQILEEFYH